LSKRGQVKGIRPSDEDRQRAEIAEAVRALTIEARELRAKLAGRGEGNES